MNIGKSVWVAFIEHRHGNNCMVSTTKRKIVNQLYSYVRRWWDSEIPDEPMPKLKNTSKLATVERYFELVQHEYLNYFDRVLLE